MQFFLASLFSAAQAQVFANKKYDLVDYEIEKFEDAISPKAVIVNLFGSEAAVWQEHYDFVHNITIPGLSPLYPNVGCTENYDVCQIVTGEGEINAATTAAAFLNSAQFNLTETYFLVNGIAGINPEVGTLGSAAFPHYAVQVALQYEVDIREAPSNWSTGYWGYGTKQPGEYPTTWYGTEVFELNSVLRDHAAELAFSAKLADSTAANKSRKLYNSSLAATLTPGILKVDVATSDVYYTGDILSESFGKTVKLLTNGSGEYGVTAQEDAAILEAALRSATFGLTDFARWVVLRTASNFDRPPAVDANDTIGWFNTPSGGFDIAIENLYRAGNPFIEDVLAKWNSTYVNGTKVVGAEPFATVSNFTNSSGYIVTNYTFNTNYTTNLTNATNGTNASNSSNSSSSAKNGTFAPTSYIGDAFGTLGGKPNFGVDAPFDKRELLA